ncbi:MAG: phospholipase A [Colwellia sp.]|nr:phospholipase A [Colwellia sp.]
MKFTLFAYVLLSFSFSTLAKNSISDESSISACIAEESRTASDDLPIGDIKKKCQEIVKNPLTKRILLEKHASSNPFAIIPHKPNYLLPLTFFNANEVPYQDILQGYSLDNVETKFQVSMKYVITRDIFVENLDIYAAFTATSWWQSYNDDISSAFRETNYEPELIFSYKSPWSFFGMTVSNTSLSFNHQSNGQAGELSRSWNRIIGGVVIVDDNLIWNLRAWYRIPEEEKSSIEDTTGDDNPNIEDYMGYGELGILWKVTPDHNIDLMFRNNLKSENKGAIQLGWSFPLSKHLRGYVEYFNGYGESLIYYNEKVSRIGIGVKLTDWL